MKFFAVFSLQLLHAYYRDGRCLDFTIEPTSETQQLLKNHRCVLKMTPNGLQVLIGCGAPYVPLIPLQKGAVFAFHLRLQNPTFALFTDLAAFQHATAPIYTNTVQEAESSQLTLISRQGKLGRGVFAAIEIGVTDALLDLAAGPAEFTLMFTARQMRWAYYCITDLHDTEVPLRIIDGDTSTLLFSDTNRLHLNQQPDPTDAVAATLGARYPDKQRFRFVSDTLIPCQQTAKKYLQLQWGTQRLAEALPNPALQHYTTLAVTGGQTAQPQDVLFHVLTYFIHTVATTGS